MRDNSLRTQLNRVVSHLISPATNWQVPKDAHGSFSGATDMAQVPFMISPGRSLRQPLLPGSLVGEAEKPRLLSCFDRQNGTCRMSYHPLGSTSKNDAVNTRFPVGSDHNEIDVLFFGKLQNLFIGKTTNYRIFDILQPFSLLPTKPFEFFFCTLLHFSVHDIDRSMRDVETRCRCNVIEHMQKIKF